MFLKELNGHPNIIGILNLLEATNNQDIYIVFDLMESDLHKVIKANILHDSHRRFILHQILKAIKYIHSGNVIHRDMKPSNILLDGNCHVKLCDFGLARSISPDSNAPNEINPIMTDYVATRWYRAPELLLGSTRYTKGIDIWAVGCILGEMIEGKPVIPGKSTIDQLELVLKFTGKPNAEDIEAIKSRYAAQMLGSIKQDPVPLQTLLPKADAQALDFLRQCLQFNPDKRASAGELLEHPYLAEFHDPSHEIECHKLVTIPLDDNVKLTVRDYRERLYQEIARMRQTMYSRNDFDAAPSPVTAVQQAPKVPQTSGPVTAKQFSYRASNLTPTTCHTSNSQSTPTTPATSTSKNIVPRSPSTKSLLVTTQSILAPPAPYRTTPVLARPASRPRVGSATRTVTAQSITTGTPLMGSALRSTSKQAALLAGPPYSRPLTGSLTQGSRLVRAPSVSSFLARARIGSPAVGKRPTTSYIR